MGEKENDVTDKELTPKTDTQFIQLNLKKSLIKKKKGRTGFPGG